MDLQERMDNAKPKAGGVPVAELQDIVLDVKYTTRAGEQLIGAFVFKHPTLGDEGDIGVQRASFFTGLAWESLAPADRDLFTAIASMNVLLKDKPRWYKLDDSRLERDLPVRIYGAFLEKRRAMFRAGDGGGEEAPRQPVVEIVPRDSEELPAVD